MVKQRKTRAALMALASFLMTENSLFANAFTAPVPIRYHHSIQKTMTAATAAESLVPLAAKQNNFQEDERSCMNGKKDKTTTTTTTTTTQPTPVLVRAFQDWVGKNSSSPTQSVAMVAAALAFAVMLSSPLSADAAMSGGRMGGSFSRSSGSTTRMMPSSGRGYSGGGGYYGGGGGGYTAGYYSRPSVTVAPIITPFVSPITPFYYGGGPGVITYHRGPGLFDLMVLGGIGFFILNAIRTAATAGSESLMSWSDSSSSLFSSSTSSALGPGTSVMQVSVALDVPDRDDPNSILSVLNRLAATARTDTRSGVSNLTSQVALELLRRKSSITAAYSTYQHFNDPNKAQREYNSMSVRERSKFEKEIVSKYGKSEYYNSRGSRSSPSGGARATKAVVTLVLAIDGDSTKVPKIKSVRDVEDALRKIASDVKVDDCLTGAEILWTPEDPSETLSFRDIVSDYPELMTL